MSLQIKDSYATIFEPEVHDKFVACNLSTGRKLKEVDDYGRPKYANSSWRATFVGNALAGAKALKEKTESKLFLVLSHMKKVIRLMLMVTRDISTT